MRLLVLSLFCFAALSKATFAQGPGLCAPDSPYEKIHKQNLENLRWSLFYVSQLKNAGHTDADLNGLLHGLANGSVTALANIYSLRARFVQDCQREPEEYYKDIAANERFIALFSATTSAQSFPTVLYIKKSQQEGRTVNFEIDSIIRQQLSLWTEHKDWPSEDARKVAASALLGRPVKLNEHNFKPITEVALSPTGSRLAESRPSKLSETLFALHEPAPNKPDWKKNLETLSNYYVKVGEHPR